MPDYRQNDLPFKMQTSVSPPATSSISSWENANAQKAAQRKESVVVTPDTAPVNPVVAPLTADSPYLTDAVEHGTSDPNLAPYLQQESGMVMPAGASVNLLGIGNVLYAPYNAPIGMYMDKVYSHKP